MRLIGFLVFMGILSGCSSTGLLSGPKTGTWIKSSGWLESPGEEVEIDLKSRKIVDTNKYIYFRNGDVLKLKAGTVKDMPQINASIIIEGAGKDKTFVDVEFNKDLWVFARNTKVIVKNLTLLNPELMLRDSSNQFIFYNVRVKGQAKIHVQDFKKKFNVFKNPVGRRKQRSTQFAFFNSDFDEPQKVAGSSTGGITLFIGPSRVGRGASMKPYMSKSIGLVKLDELHKKWLKTDVSNTQSPAYLRQLRSVMAGVKVSSQKEKQLSKVARNLHIQLYNAFEASLNEISSKSGGVESGRAKEFMAKAKKFRFQGNYLLESYALVRAKEFSNASLSGLSQAIRENKKQLHKNYGCHIVYRHLDRTPSKYNVMRGELKNYDLDKTIGESTIRESLNEISPLLTSLSSTDSGCKIIIKSHLDHFLGLDSRKVLISKTPYYEETNASRLRRSRAKQAAREAAWDAAMSRLNSATNRLTSVTKQLHKNRNKIESRSGGTYLILNNKKLKDEGYSDRQKYIEAQNKAQKAKISALSGSRDYRNAGAIYRSSYYMTFKDAYQLDLDMTGLDGQTVYFSAAPALKSKSIGPCTRTVNTSGIGASISGPCTTGSKNWSQYIGYNFNRQMRVQYVQSRVEPGLFEFINKHVVSQYIKSIQKKMKSSTKESRLDAALLSYLIGGKTKGLNIDSLSREIFGEAVSLETLKNEALFL